MLLVDVKKINFSCHYFSLHGNSIPHVVLHHYVEIIWLTQRYCSYHHFIFRVNKSRGI